MKKTTPGWTVAQFEAEVRRMDPQVNGRALKAGVVMLSALQEGTSPKRLTAFTGYSRRTVVEFVERLRQNGIFTDEGKIAAEWFHKRNGGAAFWCDVNVCLGFLRRGAPEADDAVAGQVG